ncbi:MAG TPA: PLP-dependent aspartate aminotransferase family protein [Bacteroidales bacterium]|nr:PLP-dependent aspartate aminotransferase family protein [Bacteroidales bacterium]
MKNNRINSTRTPLYRDAGFELTDADRTSEAFNREAGHDQEPDVFIYSRYRNPTVIDAEITLADIEKSKWALLTQSGMSAIDTALSVFQKKDDERPWLFFSEIYGGTNSYIDNVLIERRGINVERYYPEGHDYDLGQVEDILSKKKPSLVFFEIVSNPLLIVVPLRELIELIHSYGAAVIIDNTFATAHLVKPLDYGADLVVHSATKYLGGHGNITAGAICGNDKQLLKDAVEYRKYTGHMISPDDAYRLNTQMKSFSLRFDRQCSNAAAIAGVLNKKDIVREVLYPGLDSHKTHDKARQIFEDRGYGAIVSFSFDGENDETKRKRRDSFISSVSGTISLVPTLGDYHTILMPVEPVWGYKYPDPGMIRLSVGYEETEELLNTIRSGLPAVD